MHNASISVPQHSRTAKILYWGFILVFLYALSKQLDELEELADHTLLQYEMVFAVVFLILLIARFSYMRLTTPTVLSASAPRRMRIASQAVHLGMYFCLAMIPLTGLGIGGLYWGGPRSGSVMEGLLLAHEIFVNTGFFLIFAHVAAAFYHRRLSDGVWNSMVPIWQEPRRGADNASVSSQ